MGQAYRHRCENHGPLFLLQSLNETALDWLHERVTEEPRRVCQCACGRAEANASGGLKLPGYGDTTH